MRRISKSLVLLTFFALSLARANAVEPVDQDREFCTAGVIEDATTHKTWSVVRNMEHPAWPARLIEMRGENEQPCFSHEDMRKEGLRFERSDLVVHARDSVAIAEDAPAWHGELGAVALSSGGIGDVIRVRLRISKRVAEAIVISRDRAVFARKKKELAPWK